MANKVVERAEKWAEKVAEALESAGDSWRPNYSPVFSPSIESDEIIREEYDNSIYATGDFGDEESRFAIIAVGGLAEDEAKALCDLYNNYYEVVGELVTEIKRLEGEIAQRDEREATRRFVDKVLALSDKSGGSRAGAKL